ncbi:uncharacterized protein [Argopecten irradians]|uniref:uncharacterized protein n=1 Tax=Argopecten irradians TaxID=31199 RepID=UPI0037153012
MLRLISGHSTFTRDRSYTPGNYSPITTYPSYSIMNGTWMMLPVVLILGIHAVLAKDKWETGEANSVDSTCKNALASAPITDMICQNKKCKEDVDDNGKVKYKCIQKNKNVCCWSNYCGHHICLPKLQEEGSFLKLLTRS